MILRAVLINITHFTYFIPISAISSLLYDFSLYLGCLSAAVALHEVLLAGVLHAPMHFFDTHPLGRILSRFARDVETVDEDLPWYFGDGVHCFFEVSEMTYHLYSQFIKHALLTLYCLVFNTNMPCSPVTTDFPYILINFKWFYNLLTRSK